MGLDVPGKLVSSSLLFACAIAVCVSLSLFVAMLCGRVTESVAGFHLCPPPGLCSRRRPRELSVVLKFERRVKG